MELNGFTVAGYSVGVVIVLVAFIVLSFTSTFTQLRAAIIDLMHGVSSHDSRSTKCLP